MKKLDSQKIQMTIAAVLRLACQANGLGTTGSSTAMLKRLVLAGKKPKSAPKSGMPAKSKKAVPKKKITQPRGTVALKSVKGGGMRLSASHYFHEVCDGKISRCKPQVILQPDGRRRLKEIRIVTRGNLTYPQWVNAA